MKEIKTQILPFNEHGLSLAAQEIIGGGLVAFPTETVYGLGADALNPLAVKKIFEAKGRPADNPLIMHFSDVSQIDTVGHMSKAAQRAAELFMPGALTIVIAKRECVPDIVTGGLPTVAVRVPESSAALRFLAACNRPVAAPSANTSTRPSPTSAAHVYSDLAGKIKYILDGGDCKIGLESTILDFTTDKIRLLRRGGIPLEALTAALGDIEVYSPRNEEKPLSPGMKYRHYAPLAKVELFEHGSRDRIFAEYKRNTENGVRTIALIFNPAGLNPANLNPANPAEICNGIMAGGFCKSPQKNRTKEAAGLDGNGDVIEFNSNEEYARRLFYQLRRADDLGVNVILCELAMDFGIGRAINNRLFKAAGKTDFNK